MKEKGERAGVGLEDKMKEERENEKEKRKKKRKKLIRKRQRGRDRGSGKERSWIQGEMLILIVPYLSAIKNYEIN